MFNCLSTDYGRKPFLAIARLRRYVPAAMADHDQKAELIGKLMGALAAELGQLPNQPARREELVQLINDLSRLCHALKTGKDARLETR